MRVNYKTHIVNIAIWVYAYFAIKICKSTLPKNSEKGGGAVIDPSRRNAKLVSRRHIAVEGH